MIDYELAKKLIAENPKWIELYNADGSIVVADENRHPIGLEELIEACGEADVLELHRENNKWAAYIMDSNGKHSFKTRCFGEGSTPEEAVANLWLALNI